MKDQKSVISYDSDDNLQRSENNLFMGSRNESKISSPRSIDGMNIKEALLSRKAKNEANQQLTKFKKCLQKQGIGNQIMTVNEKIMMIPQSIQEDLDESILYIYFAVRYFDDQIFKVILTKTNKYRDYYEYEQLLAKERAFQILTQETSYARFRLNQIAFEIALDKDYPDISLHFIETGQVHLKWDMVRKMIQRRQEYLVKQCIKYGTKFDSGSAQIKKIMFAGRQAATTEDRTIKLVDFIQVMLELRWKSKDIMNVLKNYSKKGKIDVVEQREMFLMFAIKRKIKLMSYLINSDEFQMEFQELNFIDILENDAYDVCVLLYREYFLNINQNIEKILTLLVNSFSKTNGMLEAKCFLMKRFMKKLNYEQAVNFLENIEQRVFDSSKGNILILTLNVIKASCLLIELIEKIKSNFNFLSRRIFEIRQKLIKMAINYMKDVQTEEEMRFYLLEKDLDERDSLNIIYDYELIDLMENPFTQNIVQQIWTSNYNNSHFIYSASTAHTLLFNYSHCRFDLEDEMRFYQKKNLQKMGCHGYQFQVWRYSAESRYFISSITTWFFATLMHILIIQHMDLTIYLKAHKEDIIMTNLYSHGLGFSNTTVISSDQIQINQALYTMWNQRIQNFENEAMILTYLMIYGWMFFFQHLFNAIFATKNKRVMHFVNIENFLDFMIFEVGMSYMFVVYKSYRFNTFLQEWTYEQRAQIYWMNYQNNIVNENILLFVYMFIVWAKAFYRLKFISFTGPLFVVMEKIILNLIQFFFFYLVEIIIFSVIGLVLFNDLIYFEDISAAIFTLFKVTLQMYTTDIMDNARIGLFISQAYFYCFLILNLVLIINLIVGIQSYIYRKYQARRHILFLLSTMGIREVSEADDKYSAVISATFPYTSLNFLFSGIIFGMKSQSTNIFFLVIYYIPIAFVIFVGFIVYEIIIIPFCYIKIVGHKFALMIKTPQGHGSRSTFDRFFQSLLFLVFGLPILLVDSLVDIYWFLRHLFQMDLDKSHLSIQQGQQIQRRTYRQMFGYFEQKNEQLVPQKKVAEDLREYLDVIEGIKCMVFGRPNQVPIKKKSLYQAYFKGLKNQELTHKELMKLDELNNDQYEVEQVVAEFEVVKQVLLNNSVPVNIQEIQKNSVKAKGWGMKLLFDKKLFYNLLLDLSRMRKVLNLKKCFFIFHIQYEGKPKDMNNWHIKVENRVNQTLKFLNTARLLKIIGYDPTIQIRMEKINFSNQMSQSVKKIQQYQRDSVNLNQIVFEDKQKQFTKTRIDHLQENMMQMIQKFSNATKQIRDYSDILKKINMNNNVDVSRKKMKKQKKSQSSSNKIDSKIQTEVNYSNKKEEDGPNKLQFHYSERSNSEAVISSEEDQRQNVNNEDQILGFEKRKRR